MSKWVIDKQFSFCYGHRVWVQKLENEYCATGDYNCKCRHLHGHEGLVHVFLEASNLNEQSMVTDFKHLGWLKNFLDDNIDHKFVVDINDPLFNKLLHGSIEEVDWVVEHEPTGRKTIEEKLALDIGRDTVKLLLLDPVVVPGTEHVAGWKLNLSRNIDTNLQEEFYGGFFLVNFVPTSENLSKWLYEAVNAKMKKLGVAVSRIDWFETPKSRSSYGQTN